MKAMYGLPPGVHMGQKNHAAIRAALWYNLGKGVRYGVFISAGGAKDPVF